METLRRLLAGDDEGREAARAAAAVLIGSAFAMIYVRRSGGLGGSWGDLPLFLVFLVPAVALYGLGMLATRTTGPRAWQPVPIVFGLLFIVLALYQFVELIGGDSSAPLNTFWIFALVAAAAFLAGIRADVRFGLLAGGLAVLVSLLGLFDALLPDGLLGDIGTFRGVSVLIAAGLGAAGLWFIRRDPGAGGRRGGELLTAAGLAFVTGAGLASTIGLSSTIGPIPAPGLGGAPFGGNSSLFWDVVLLAGSVVLIVAGARFDARGPGYVGALGLLTFVFVAGLDLDDPSPEPSLLGWPLVLLLAGAIAFVLSIQGAVRLGPRRATQGPPTEVHDAPGEGHGSPSPDRPAEERSTPPDRPANEPPADPPGR